MAGPSRGCTTTTSTGTRRWREEGTQRIVVVLDLAPQWPGQPRRVRSTHHGLRRAVPACAISQRVGESGDEIVVHRRIGLEVYSLDLEGSLLAVGLGVEPAHEGAVVENREGVVSVPAAGSRGVDLDLILEVEELQGPRPVPDHRIERGQQGRDGRPQPAG